MSQSVTEQMTVQSSRLQHFPISFFAIVMGMSGFTIAWKVAGKNIIPQIELVAAVFTSIFMLVITGLYLLKIFRYPKDVMHEISHPIRLNFFPAFSISLLLLSIVWNEYPSVSFSLWSVGAVVQLSLTLYVMSSWIHHTHYTLTHFLLLL